MLEAVLAAGSEKAAAHRLGLSHATVKHHLASARSKVGATTTAQLVWILAPRLPEGSDHPHETPSPPEPARRREEQSHRTRHELGPRPAVSGSGRVALVHRHVNEQNF